MTVWKRPTRPAAWLPALHRWLGLGALACILVLSTTGIALNHSSDWSLANRHVAADWLLHWYGIDAPAVTVSFRADGHTVAVMGERLYLDEIEITAVATDLVGAVWVVDRAAVASPSHVLLIEASGAIIEDVPVSGRLPGPVAAIGTSGERLIYRVGSELFESDLDLLELTPRSRDTALDPIWSEPAALDPIRLEALRRLYRGQGLTLERVLLDLHSGRIFARAGPLLMDITGLALILLSLLGLALWLRRWRVRRRRI